jgi:hypothetical protein
MTYRDDPRPCPSCERPLYEHGDQLVCDSCHGTLLPIDRLAASLTELDRQPDPILVRDPTPERVKCPRCTNAMSWVSLQRGPHLLPGRFLCCTEHGAWVPRESIVSTYARASRGDRRMPGPSDTRGAAGNAYMDVHPQAVGFRAVRDAFQVSTPTIGQYELPRPIVHQMFVSAFRGHRLTCPTCAGAALEFAGDRWACATCAGTFVEDAALVAMISDILHTAWEMPPAAGAPGERKCPVCADAMTVEMFESITVDRCSKHGQWFDAEELGQALLHAGDPPRHMAGWLKRLFRP